jgi:hypothetical protein
MVLLLHILMATMMMGRKSNIAMRNHRIELLVDSTIVIHALSSKVHHIANTLVQECH